MQLASVKALVTGGVSGLGLAVVKHSVANGGKAVMLDINDEAGAAAEAGKSLRVPGTNPFFFTNDALQGRRLLELLETMPDLEVYLMSTGRVGGGDDDDRSKKVRIKHSSAVVQGIVEGSIVWEEDPDFGYLIAADLPRFPDPEILQPRRLYERQGRMDEYNAIVSQLKTERREFLASFPGLDESIVNSI